LVLDARCFRQILADFGKKTTDYYELIKLSPAYRVYFGVDEFITIADNLAEIEATFESIEEGSGAVLHKFITESSNDMHIKDLVYRPGVSPLEL
jgi:phytoene desaturase